MRNNPEVQQAVSLYQLGLPHIPSAGRSGEMLGRGTGSSVEFQEYRDYFPGDDIRHLDWAAYGRSDSLMVRLYREEISPQTEILVDATSSMRTGNGIKKEITKQLAAMFSLMMNAVGGRPKLFLLDDAKTIQPHGNEGLDLLEQHPFDAIRSLDELLHHHQLPLKQQSVRIVISDFLFPHDPELLIKRLAANASTLWVVQVLTQFEAAPETVGGRRLIDVETDAQIDLMIDPKAITLYLERLGRLQTELSQNCRRAHAVFVTVVAERGLASLCQNELTKAGILRPT